MSILDSLKSMAATATLSLMATTAAAQPNADIDPPSVQPVNFEAAYRSANQVEGVDSTKVLNANSLGDFLQDLFNIPKKEDLSMVYTVDPLTVSEAAKVGQFPLVPQADGSLGIAVMPLSEMSDNTPKEFFEYTKYYFNSGVVTGEDGERSYTGYANTHVAIAVDPDDPSSVAKIQELNEMLTAKIKGDPANDVAGWAETYGLAIDAIIPIYIDDRKSVAYSDAYYAYDKQTLKDGDMFFTMNNQPLAMDSDRQAFNGAHDMERLSILMEELLKTEGHLLTRSEYQQKNMGV